MRALALFAITGLLYGRPNASPQSIQLDFDSVPFGGVQIVGASSDMESLYKQVKLKLEGSSVPPASIVLAVEFVGPTSQRQIVGAHLPWPGDSRLAVMALPIGIVSADPMLLGDARRGRLWIREIAFSSRDRVSRANPPSPGGHRPDITLAADCASGLNGRSHSMGSAAKASGFDCTETEHNLYCFNNGSSCTSELCWTDDPFADMCHFKVCTVVPSALSKSGPAAPTARTRKSPH